MIDLVSIEECCFVFNGKTPSRSEQRRSGRPILKIKDIDEAGKFRGKFESFVDESFYEKHSKKVLKRGDTVILNAAHNRDYVGNKIARIGPELDGVIATGEWLIIRPKNIDQNFIYHFIKSPKGREGLKRIVRGIHLYPRDVGRLTIPFPENIDQERISYILNNVDSLILIRKKAIGELDRFITSFFVKMFGDPVRNEKAWEVKPLGQLGTLDRGVSKHRPRNAPELLGGDYPLIQTGDVANSGIYIEEYTQSYSDQGLAQSKLWPKGTLCITIAANIAKTAILNFEACFPDSVVGFLASKNESNNLYVYALFQFLHKILEKKAPEAAQKNINLKILRQLSVPCPPIEHQNKFSAVIEKVYLLQRGYSENLTNLEELYGAISQKAFTGRLDLSGIPAVGEADFVGRSELSATADVESPLDEYPMDKAEGRERLLRQWFDELIGGSEHETDLTFDQFWQAVQVRAVEYMGDDDKPFSTTEYDLYREWVLDGLREGKIKQEFDEGKNLVTLRVAG
ncbi:MAG TPA: restriction endonuclease subunit S [Hyphomonas atlantica]|uniref:Restriction endonuclease subunit S n=1 Tax=Hyphomonas atlantica TaxID=1280948 RepID=A0A356W3J8_9PROT|nr:type I restriction endonuclease subunit S [Magnetovibrio sp.]MAY68038.1 type I restriction endonuclease subunit S [Rhodospirillaceae bacterium]HBQ48147.1 restriction endonuclease subunit S [Hyphomonas atlantica]